MTNKTVKCVGVNYTISIPETAAEFDSLAKREGACVDEAVNNVIYRGTNADFRSAYLDALIAKTGIERELVDDPSGKKDEKGAVKQVPKNSEGKDVDIIVAQAGLDEAAQQAIADEVMSAKDDKGNALVSFDPSARVRAPREAAIGKQDLETALSFLTGDQAKLTKVIKNIKKQGGVEVVLTGDQAVDQRAIAAGIKAVRNNLAAALSA